MAVFAESVKAHITRCESLRVEHTYSGIDRSNENASSYMALFKYLCSIDHLGGSWRCTVQSLEGIINDTLRIAVELMWKHCDWI